MNTNPFITGDIIKEKQCPNILPFTNCEPFVFHSDLVDKDGFLTVLGKGQIFVNEVNFELVKKANETIEIPVDVIANILKYCEINAIYDKLGNYGDFYYKLKQSLK